MTKPNSIKQFFQTVAKCIVCLALLGIVGCECLYLEEQNSPYEIARYNLSNHHYQLNIISIIAWMILHLFIYLQQETD
jgi:hypothetical protein